MNFDEEYGLYLREMGLSEYEAGAYLALLRQGTGTAKEIANASGIPQSRIYDVLEKLEEKGFVTIQMGRPKRFGAIEPELAVEQFLKHERSEFEEEISQVETIGNEFLDELSANQFQYKHHDEFDIFWSYEGKNYLLEQFGQMCCNTDDCIRMLTTVGSFERIVTHHKEILSERSGRGVSIRVLVNQYDRINDAVLETARGWAAVHPTDGIQGRIYLFDSNRILLAFRNDADTNFVGILTRSDQMYATLSHLFELVWAEYADRETAVS